MAQDNPDYVEYASVRLGADGAAEMDGNRRLVYISRAEVMRLELVHGSAAERPWLSLTIAVILMAVALLGPAMLLLALLGRGTVEVKFVTSIAFIVPAAWLLDLVIRRRWFLKVHSAKGSRKLIFGKASDPVAMQQFVVSAKERFGYS
ncbi:MAG TPA: hypothetical protein VN380_03130 [Thermoanaerobaculia bacterium]|jgi:hypothetical protein|nr:hypothetical protein [Thermoanaerobaculia bacterium]